MYVSCKGIKPSASQMWPSFWFFIAFRLKINTWYLYIGIPYLIKKTNNVYLSMENSWLTLFDGIVRGNLCVIKGIPLILLFVQLDDVGASNDGVVESNRSVECELFSVSLLTWSPDKFFFTTKCRCCWLCWEWTAAIIGGPFILVVKDAGWFSNERDVVIDLLMSDELHKSDKSVDNLLHLLYGIWFSLIMFLGTIAVLQDINFCFDASAADVALYDEDDNIVHLTSDVAHQIYMYFNYF